MGVLALAGLTRNSRRLVRAHQFAEQTFVNDLERPVFEKFVFLAQLKMWLLKQPEVGAALMSGSGSTVFAVIRDNTDVDTSGNACKSGTRSGIVDVRVRNAVANSGSARVSRAGVGVPRSRTFRLVASICSCSAAERQDRFA